MDPLTVIAAALAAGALKGVGETASAAVADAYRGLKGLVTGRIGSNPRAELVVDEYEADPETWQVPLLTMLSEGGADRDEQVLAAARRLLELTDPQGSSAGKYAVDARGANVGAIGDHSRQHNTFGTPSAQN
ncbi:hypothetical protein [Nocardia anaemiae]|uniref:hypothetical protein n=1 Tax=Nocardia anaemiae TaxID=263910 RepID=UPI0007C658C4|nr:hypothetical protein [Nocardia anaemiae]